MRTIKIKVTCDPGNGDDYHDVLDVEVHDSATQEEIEAACALETTEWATNIVSWGYEIIK